MSNDIQLYHGHSLTQYTYIEPLFTITQLQESTLNLFPDPLVDNYTHSTLSPARCKKQLRTDETNCLPTTLRLSLFYSIPVFVNYNDVLPCLETFV